MKPSRPPVSPSPAAPATPVDWAAIRARVERTGQTLAGGEEAPARIETVLRRRAQELAAPLPGRHGADRAEERGLEVVSARIGGQAFGIDAQYIREAVRAPRITPLPGLPPALRGLANVRSRILPAFDPRPLLNLPPPDAGAPRETLLLLSCDDADFGLLVDEVLGARSVPAAGIRSDVPGLAARYLRGVAGDGLILLDLPAIAAALATRDGQPA